ncbi:MAG TPA: energy-coupling factor ABC transporter ATP-binding protein [Bacillales bacterium]|nr:energy-coupling factor ABC transporter ATP-binding protein [Bacillales bacterium]
MAKQLIEAKGLSFRYYDESDWVIRNLDLSVHEGEWLAVVGHNGSGKSTLAKLLNGLLPPETGSVAVEGFLTTDPEDIWEVRRRVGLVFQNPDNQFVGTTVRDDVAFGMENRGIPREEMIRRIEEAVSKVNMTDFLMTEPHRLSGGQKQRVAIAGILAVQPSIIILDEATSMLDPKGRKEVLETVRQLNREEQTAVISITHDLSEVLLADRICVMNEGEIVQSGTSEEVFQHGDALRRMGLDLPFSVKLREQLAELGLPVSEGVITEEELVEELWRLKLNN